MGSTDFSPLRPWKENEPEDGDTIKVSSRQSFWGRESATAQMPDQETNRA